MKCAVIGVGYLGNFHAQKYAQLDDVELIAVCDMDKKRCDEVAQANQTQAVYDYRELLGKVDAVSIAVPTRYHHQVAKDFLKHNTHVLVEKPITSTLEEADDLCLTANQHNVVLQTGHLERFNTVLKALDSVIDNPLFIECVRQAPFKPRVTDVNVVLDLMIHDIDLMNQLVGSPIVQINASGSSVLTDKIDIANARIQYHNGCVANVVASRVNFELERKIRIFQHNAFITLDLQHKKLGIHRKGDSETCPGTPAIISEEQVFEQGDALLDEIIAFLACIRHNTPPIVSGYDGREALATAIDITQLVQEQMTHHATSSINSAQPERLTTC